MPTPDNPQPQPGPSPTPSPKPTAVIPIGQIIAEVDGATIVPVSEWLPSFFVTNEYLATCSPAVGGYFVEFPECVTFMSAQDFEERYA